MKVFSESFKNNFDENHIIGIGLTKEDLKIIV